jgi:hypothetical protein
MFYGDPRKMSTTEAASRLGSVGWLVKPKYERVEVSNGEQEWQLAYSTPTSIAVYTQDVEWLLAQGPCVVVELTSSQFRELFEQYHEDTHILQELGIKTKGSSIHGRSDRMRELAKLMVQDYDLETGFETVSVSLKRTMLRAASRIAERLGS